MDESFRKEVEKERRRFSRNVTALRRSHGLTQKEMAAIMEIGVGSLRQIERGIMPPRLSADVLYHLSAYFCIPVSDLFR